MLLRYARELRAEGARLCERSRGLRSERDRLEQSLVAAAAELDRVAAPFGPVVDSGAEHGPSVDAGRLEDAGSDRRARA